MQSQDIVRIKERAKRAFLVREILGLNIFRANGVDSMMVRDDPRIAFIRNLCLANKAGLNIGNLFDYADDPEELFSGTDWSGKYQIVNVGCYGGQFYDSRKWATFPPLFFETISNSFFDITTKGESLLRKILQIDAIAYFVAPRDATSAIRMIELLNEPFESSEALTERSLDLFKLVGFSQADGDFYSFASRSSEDFLLIDEHVTSAVRLIEESDWYLNNRSELRWDNDYSVCLKKV